MKQSLILKRSQLTLSQKCFTVRDIQNESKERKKKPFNDLIDFICKAPEVFPYCRTFHITYSKCLLYFL